MNYKEFLKDKNVAVIGLGPHGEMITDIKFLVRFCSDISVYDMRSEKKFKTEVSLLRNSNVRKIRFGRIEPTDLLIYQLIIISPEISKKSFFLKKAIESGIQIEYPETLFFKLAPAITLVGVLGEYGKSTVSYLLFNMFKKAFSDYEDQNLFFMDPESSTGSLSHLRKIKKGDVVLARLPNYLLPHLVNMRISPHVAVVVSTISFDILEFQTYNNFIVAPDNIVDTMKVSKKFQSRAKILRTRPSLIPIEWNIEPYPIYNYDNVALALQSCELFKIPTETIREVSSSFSGLKGRMEFIKKINNIEFYNDAFSANPDSTLLALQSLRSRDTSPNIILIMGGAYTGHDYGELIRNIGEYTKRIILISGSGIIDFRSELKRNTELEIIQCLNLEDAVKKAKDISKKGDRILFSPAFDAVGVDISRKERSDKFIRIVKSL